MATPHTPYRPGAKGRTDGGTDWPATKGPRRVRARRQAERPLRHGAECRTLPALQLLQHAGQQALLLTLLVALWPAAAAATGLGRSVDMTSGKQLPGFVADPTIGLIILRENVQLESSDWDGHTTLPIVLTRNLTVLSAPGRARTLDINMVSQKVRRRHAGWCRTMWLLCRRSSHAQRSKLCVGVCG